MAGCARAPPQICLKIRFQADADLRPSIGKGLCHRYPWIDFRFASGIIPDAMEDLDVLLLAARDSRVLVSADVSTMSMHFYDFTRKHNSPGLILIPGSRTVSQAIDDLFAAWTFWPAARLRNQLLWPSDIYKHF